MIQCGVEAYFADYRKMETTYYTAQDQTHTVPMHELEVAIPTAFSALELQNAIRAAQRDEIRYPEFQKCSMTAECVGYFVWITGKQVHYFGRHGEIHLEKFPR